MCGTAIPRAMSRLRWRTPLDASIVKEIMNLLDLIFLFFEVIVNIQSRLKNLIE